MKVEEKTISEKEVLELIKKDYSKAWNNAKNKNFIFRGVYSKDNYIIIEPSKFERKSAYMSDKSNHYTLLLSNLPSWKRYPRRDKSLICSTTFATAASFSNSDNVFLVLPKNNSKIGVCSEDDLWGAFYNVIDTNDSTILQLNYGLRVLGVTSSDYNSMKNEVNKIFKDNLINVNRLPFKDNIKANIIKDLKTKSMINILNDILSPERNDFKLVKSGDKLPINREVWTDGKCVLINTKSLLFESEIGF